MTIMANIIKIKDLYGDFHYICLDKLVSVSESVHRLSNGNGVLIWHIILIGDSIDVDKDTYSEEALIAGLRGYDAILYEDYDKRHPKQQEIAPPDYKYPETITRYDFKYIKDSIAEVDEYIEYEYPCYFMDGMPLESPACLMTTNMVRSLYQEYSFDDPIKQMSWISIDGNPSHPALLFNHRTK